MSICLVCDKPLSGYQQQFCSRRCAASHNNTLRASSSRDQQRITILSNLRGIPADGLFTPIHHCQCYKCEKFFYSTRLKKHCGCLRPKVDIVGEFTKIYRCTCKVCDLKFLSPKSRQFCDEHKHHHTNKRTEYRFKFNVYDYPDLFNLELLNQVGFYAPGGKSGSWNVQGLSRDHRVSVDEAIRNDYDPYYISHPINCELMPHSENSSKKRRSSISYNELVRLADAYDSRKTL